MVEGNWGGAYEFTHNKIGTTWKENKAIDQMILVLKYKTNLVMPFEHWKKLKSSRMSFILVANHTSQIAEEFVVQGKTNLPLSATQ